MEEPDQRRSDDTNADGWPPEDIDAMLKRMEADPTAPDWGPLRKQVLSFAGRYDRRWATYLDEADDLAQVVLFKLTAPGKLAAVRQMLEAARAAGAPPRETFLKYLRGMAYWCWRDRLRYYNTRKPIRPVQQPPPGAREDAEETDPLLAAPDPSLSVEETVEQTSELHELRERLRAVWDKLRAIREQGEREAEHVRRFVLAWMKGLSHEEVARICGCKPTQVRDSIQYILRKLRAPEEGGDTGPAALACEMEGASDAAPLEGTGQRGSRGPGKGKRPSTEAEAGKAEATPPGPRPKGKTRKDQTAQANKTRGQRNRKAQPQEPDVTASSQPQEPDVVVYSQPIQEAPTSSSPPTSIEEVESVFIPVIEERSES